MWNEVQETVKFLKNKGITAPDYGIILGTGLGNLVEKITIEIAIPYAEIPNFPVSTIEGHSGELIFGVLGGKKVLAMRGRFHYYEGWTMEQTIFPVRVMKFLGVEKLIVSTYKFLIKMNDLHEVQQKMIVFLKNLSNIYPQDLRKEFIKLHSELIKFENHPHEKRAFLYLDILSWLESKIQNSTVEKIIQQKAKKITK